MNISEVVSKQKKAGLLPYIVNTNKEVEYMFMISSNPKFGGSKPAIAKGDIDPGESMLTAAIREAQEELGLVPANMIGTPKFGWSGNVTSGGSSYSMTIYYVQVKDQTDFTQPHYETGSTHWMTHKKFMKVGKYLHKNIVSRVNTLVCQTLQSQPHSN